MCDLRSYFSAEALAALKLSKTLVIQCYWRGCVRKCIRGWRGNALADGAGSRPDGVRGRCERRFARARARVFEMFPNDGGGGVFGIPISSLSRPQAAVDREVAAEVCGVPYARVCMCVCVCAALALCISAFLQAAEAARAAAEARHRTEMERRMHPRSGGDFAILCVGRRGCDGVM